MGYELDKLKNLYGVSSPSSSYQGMSAPVPPTAPTALKSGATADEQTAYNKAVDTYNTGLANYNTNLPKYQEDQKLYNQYRDLYSQRMLGTKMYDPAANRQFLSGPVYSGADANLAAAPRYTQSFMPASQETLPTLVSKYATAGVPATGGTTSGTTGGTTDGTTGGTLSHAGMTQAQAQAKYDTDKAAYNRLVADQYVHAIYDPRSSYYYGQAPQNYYNSNDPAAQQAAVDAAAQRYFQNSTDPGYSNERGNILIQNGIYQFQPAFAAMGRGATVNNSNLSAAQKAYETAMMDWSRTNQFGQGNYTYGSAKGGPVNLAHGGLANLAHKYAEGGKVAGQSDLDAGNAALQKQDYKTAADYFTKAAQAGNGNAQNNLGVLYAQGTGVPRNDVEAAKWMLIANQNGYGNIDKNSNYYWISQRMPESQINAAKQGMNDFLHPEEAKARQEAEAQAQAEAQAKAQAEAQAKAQAEAQAQAQAEAQAKAQAEAQAKAQAEAEAAAQAAQAAQASTTANTIETAANESTTLSDLSNKYEETDVVSSTDTGAAKSEQPPTLENLVGKYGNTIDASDVIPLGDNTPPVVTPAVTVPDAVKTLPDAVAALPSGTMNAPALSGAPITQVNTPALGSGTTTAPAAIGTATTNNPVTQSIFGNISTGIMQAPAVASNPLTDLYSKYQTQQKDTMTQSAQAHWNADRNNYIRSLYGLGNYSDQAVSDWEKNNVLGQGKYKYAKGGAVKTNYAAGDLVDLSGADDAEGTDTGTTVVGVNPSAYDALLAKYKDVDPTKIAEARADYRAKQQALVDQMSQYAASQKAEKPDKSEMYFRLAQAFLTPGKTGSFGEGIAQAGGVMADYQKDLRAQRRADAAAQLQLGMKQNELLANMSQEDLQALESQQGKIDTARRDIELAKIKAGGTTSGMSEYEKVAAAEGKVKGTPEFQQRVTELWNMAHRPPANAASNLTSGDLINMVDRFIAGDKSAAPTSRSGAAYAAFQHALTARMKELNLNPEDILAKQQELVTNQKIRNDYAGHSMTSAGGQISAVNRFFHHADLLNQLSDTLSSNRTDNATLNKIRTAFEKEFNTPMPNDLNLVGIILADELSKTAIGGVGGQGERERLQATLTGGGLNSATIKSALQRAKQLAAGQVETLKQTWVGSGFDDREPFDTKFLTPLARSSLDAMKTQSSGLTVKQQQALDWLKANPNDAHAAGVRATLQKQGVKF